MSRILVVDDDAGTREVLVDILEGTRAEVRTASSAEEALRTVEEYRPDLLISDIVMPGGDGYTFIGRVRGLGPSRGGDVPALALSALATAEDQERSLAAGFQMHLAKPVDFRRLEAALLAL
ncbi:MAG: response regulator [Myxococcota bacterium]|nr:response regulator [Myxococcota bacterium]